MNFKFKIIILSIFTLLVSCVKNPFTGKSTMAFISNNQIFSLSLQQYNQFLSENKVVTGTTDAKRIELIGLKIKTASERWLVANKNSEYLNNYSWEYKLVDSKEINAWCMPGGKIVFYTGILPICKDDAGIAAVMGHEVAHALANHGQQRMSAGFLQQLGAVGTKVLIGNKDPKTKNKLMQFYGFGSQVTAILPFSRSHENEADMIGLTLMAIAGYNPETAVAFWERMAEQSARQSPPEFMSTHPSNTKRIAKIKELIPSAKVEAAKFGVTFN